MTPTTICQGFIGVNTPRIWNILLFCVHVEHAGHTRISVWFWSRVCYYRLTGPNSAKHVKSESRYFQYPLLILTFHFHTTNMHLTCFNLDWTVGKQGTMLLRTNAFFLLSILEMVCDLYSVQQKTNFIYPSHLIFFCCTNTDEWLDHNISRGFKWHQKQNSNSFWCHYKPSRDF